MNILQWLAGGMVLFSMVHPGEMYTNADGVCLAPAITSPVGGNIFPKLGLPTSATVVQTARGFHGTIGGLDGNDNAFLKRDSRAIVYGFDGHVWISRHSRIQVVNQTPAGPLTPVVTVHIPGGGTDTVVPGQTKWYFLP